MQLSENISSRRSIRKFKEDAPVTDEQLKLLLEAAMAAPSACNQRPWEFLVITNKKRLIELADNYPNVVTRTASLAIVVCALTEKHNGISEGFFPQDCGAATQNILLQAYDMGLGTCWCGFYPKEPKTSKLSRELGLAENVVPINVVAIGVPDESPERRGFYDEEKVKFLK